MINGRPYLKNTPCPEFVQQFLLRVQDVIDNYSPDILNFDDGAQFDFDAGGKFATDLKVWLGIPALAPQIMDYYYKKSVQAHGGHLEGVVDLKVVPAPVWGTLTRDFEMSLADRLQERPRQTEACIGLGTMTELSLRTKHIRRPRSPFLSLSHRQQEWQPSRHSSARAWRALQR